MSTVVGCILVVIKVSDDYDSSTKPDFPVSKPLDSGQVGGARVTPPTLSRLRTFESLRVPAFRWYLISTLGLGGAFMMHMIVTGYVVFVLTDSYAALGIVALADAISGLLLNMWGGVLADRFPKKQIMQIGLLAAAFVVTCVAILLVLDVLVFWHLIASMAIEGAIFALLMPARQAMIPESVGLKLLQNAVALNMGCMSVMRLIAPAIGGVLLAVIGAEYVYLFIAGCFIFTAGILSRIPNIQTSALEDSTLEAEYGVTVEVRRAIRELIDGFRYLAENPTVPMLILSNIVIVMFSMPYMTILPGYVLDVLKGGPETIGVLHSIAGLGSVVGTLIVASMSARHRGLVLLAGPFLMGIALVIFTMSTELWIVGSIMLVISLGQTFRMSLNNVLVHTYVADSYRGRMMSIQMMQWTVVSLGGFVLGVFASIVGPVAALRGMAVLLLIIVVAVAVFIPRLRNLD